MIEAPDDSANCELFGGRNATELNAKRVGCGVMHDLAVQRQCFFLINQQ